MIRGEICKMNKEQDGNIYYYYVPSIVTVVDNNEGSRYTRRIHNYIVSGYELIIDSECMEMLDNMVEELGRDYNHTGIYYMDDIESVSITGVYESSYDSNIKWLETGK